MDAHDSTTFLINEVSLFKKNVSNIQNTCVTKCSRRCFVGLTSFSLYSIFPICGSGGNCEPTVSNGDPTLKLLDEEFADDDDDAKQSPFSFQPSQSGSNNPKNESITLIR